MSNAPPSTRPKSSPLAAKSLRGWRRHSQTPNTRAPVDTNDTRSENTAPPQIHLSTPSLDLPSLTTATAEQPSDGDATTFSLSPTLPPLTTHAPMPTFQKPGMTIPVPSPEPFPALLPASADANPDAKPSSPSSDDTATTRTLLSSLHSLPTSSSTWFSRLSAHIPLQARDQPSFPLARGVFARQQLTPIPPLPDTWAPDHDRFICMLDARAYPVSAILQKLRRAFPGLTRGGGRLTAPMLDRRLQLLDQNPNIDYWALGIRGFPLPGEPCISDSASGRKA